MKSQDVLAKSKLETNTPVKMLKDGYLRHIKMNIALQYLAKFMKNSIIVLHKISQFFLRLRRTFIEHFNLMNTFDNLRLKLL